MMCSVSEGINYQDLCTVLEDRVRPFMRTGANMNIDTDEPGTADMGTCMNALHMSLLICHRRCITSSISFR